MLKSTLLIVLVGLTASTPSWILIGPLNVVVVGDTQAIMGAWFPVTVTVAVSDFLSVRITFTVNMFEPYSIGTVTVKVLFEIVASLEELPLSTNMVVLASPANVPETVVLVP